MLVVLAGRNDPAARSLVARWNEAGHPARVLTCSDLSRPGWAVHAAAPRESTAVIGGQVTTASDVRGVLVRLPCVAADELPHIASQDRPFVASEMQAFLTYWLSTLECRVVNRPTQAGFGGPSWTREEWVTRATQLGIPARPAQRRARLGDTKEPPFKAKPTVTVVGGRCFGSEEPVLRTRAFQLAAYSEADVLAVHFDGDGPSALFLDADPWVNVWDQVVGDAILECLMDGAAC